MKKIIYILFFLLSILSFGQESEKNKKLIRGFVFDNSYFINTLIPVNEVNITINGTERKTITDIDGKFEIEAKKGEKLIISGFGIKTIEILVTDDYCYKINLSSKIFDLLMPKKVARKIKRQEHKIERKVKRKIKEGFYDCLD